MDGETIEFEFFDDFDDWPAFDPDTQHPCFGISWWLRQPDGRMEQRETGMPSPDVIVPATRK